MKRILKISKISSLKHNLFLRIKIHRNKKKDLLRRIIMENVDMFLNFEVTRNALHNLSTFIYGFFKNYFLCIFCPKIPSIHILVYLYDIDIKIDFHSKSMKDVKLFSCKHSFKLIRF